MHVLLVFAASAFQERRSDRGHTKAAIVELLPHRPQGAGRVVDDLYPVDRTQLDGVDPKLLAHVERQPEARVDLVRQHTQLHPRACINP